MKISIFRLLYLICLSMSQLLIPMHKEINLEIMLPTDHPLVHQSPVLNAIINPSYPERITKAAIINFPGSLHELALIKSLALLWNKSKSNESLLKNYKPETLCSIIRTADYLGWQDSLQNAFVTLFNKLMNDPKELYLLKSLTNHVRISDFPASSINKLKDALFDQLSKSDTAHFKASLKDHGEPIESITTNGRFIATKSDTIVQIFDLIDENSSTWKAKGDFVDVALTNNNLVAIGHSDGIVQWGPFTCGAIKKYGIKSITHPGLIKIAINAQGSYVATGSYPDNIIKIWDGETATQLWEINAYDKIKKLYFSSDKLVKYITHSNSSSAVHLFGITEPFECFYKGTANLTTRTNETKKTEEPNFKLKSFHNYQLATDIIPNGKYLNVYSYKSSINTLLRNLSLEEILLLTTVFDHLDKYTSRYPLYRYPSLMEIYQQSNYAKQLISKQVALNVFWSYWPL